MSPVHLPPDHLSRDGHRQDAHVHLRVAELALQAAREKGRTQGQRAEDERLARRIAHIRKILPRRR